MKEWKIIGIFSVVVNVLLVALLWLTVGTAKGIIDNRNIELAKLQEEMTQVEEQPQVATASVEPTVAVEQEKAVAQQQVQPTVEAVQVVEEQKAVTAQPVQQTSYEEKLLSYKPSLKSDYEYIYFLYDGMPSEDILYESMNNAEITAMYEEFYEKGDAILNKVYGILKETLPESEFTALRTEQRAWLQSVTKSKEDRLAMGGSSARGDALFNLGIDTQQRCVELMTRYFGFESY